MQQHNTPEAVVKQVLTSELSTLVAAAMAFIRELAEGKSAQGSESAFRAQVLAFGAKAMRVALEQAHDVLRERLRSQGHRDREGQRCEGSLRSKGNQEITIQTLLGPIRVRQWRGQCRQCGQSVGSVKEALEVVEGMSAACAHVATLTAVSLPFEKAQEQLLQTSHVVIDDNRLQRTVLALGPKAESLVRQPPDDLLAVLGAPPPGHAVYVLIDGGRIRLRPKQWREPIPALVMWEDAQGEWVKVGISDPLEKEPVLQVLDRWMACWRARGVEVVIIADGAEWIWKWAEPYPWAITILDYYHLKEHVWKAAHILYGEGTTKAAVWVEKIMDRLWRGWEGSTVALLDRKRPSGAGRLSKEGALNALATYIDNHPGMMRYAQHRKAGRLIGSGAIESFCKQLFTMRMKGAGMFWSEAGARALMALRTVYLTGHWDKLWSRSQTLRTEAA